MAYGDLSRIRTNIGAFNALNTLNVINKALGKSQLQLATGKRINMAGDDPAGYSIAKEMEGKAMRYGQALKNIGDGKNLMFTAETGMTAINDILTQMSMKVTQAASDTLGATDRLKIKTEIEELTKEIDQLVAQTQWRDIKLLNGEYLDKILWVGPESGSVDNSMTITLTQNFAAGSVSSGLDVEIITTSTAAAAVTDVSGTVSGADAATATALVVTYPTDPNYSGYTEIATGRYEIEVTRTDSGTFGTETITVQFKDSDGGLLYIDADGCATTDGLSQTLTTTVGSAASATLDLGRGIELTIGTALTANDWLVDYQRATASGHSISDSTNASAYLDRIKTAIANVSTAITKVGSYEERLLIKENAVAAHETNVWAAYSRIMDADMAKTQLSVTKFTILQQSAVAGLAQANVAPSFVLGLLGG